MPNSYSFFFSKRLLLLLPFLFLLRTGQATHIVGGELELQYRSGNTYRLTLNLYFDAINGNRSAEALSLTASIFAKTSNQRMQNVRLPRVSDTFVAYSNPACTIPSLSTRLMVYTSDVELPAAVYSNPSGYYVAVESCYRNNGISNIVNPGGSGQAFYLDFPAVVRNGRPFINSTPHIFPPLSDYACRGELFYYNFGGQDADGDSLVYELATPLNGHCGAGNTMPIQAEPLPYDPIRWLPGFSEQNQIPGAPALSVGRTTGRLEVRPTQLGLFVFSIRCSEYRNGEKIGEVRRDFQLKVITCSSNTDPSVQVLKPGTRTLYQASRDTLRLVEGSNRCLNLRFTDSDPASTLTLSLSPVNFSGLLPTLSTVQGTVRTPGAPDTLASQLCFPTCFDTKGKVYLLDVIVADNGCSLPRRDTVRVAFTAKPEPNTAPLLTTSAALPLRVHLGDVVTFDVVATDPDNDAVTLDMTGRNFTPANLGAQFTPGAGTANTSRGRFSWRVTCAAVGTSLYEFVFTAAASPCAERQATTVVIPIQVEYINGPPVLTSTLPPTEPNATAVAVVRRPLGGTYEATLTALDIDQDALVLSATGNGFDLAPLGMSFVPVNANGRAQAIFRWEPSCEAVARGGLEVTFRLQEASCSPRTITRTVRFEVFSTDTASFLPANVFTPNGDQKNDFFELPSLPPDFCGSYLASIKIFTRWGNEVYRTTNRDLHWDGHGLPAGVYYYLIEYTDKKRFRGTVTIVK
ncbi:gliding motility-associated C-terminal domain-containing protein [Hymenobacter cavernae]|uniref:Gliding motility-associated C-terminal domain-containing protein n=1 Tax=Hymenobacter cavernae TaxID=2044852 RepID=A0ABQ1U5Z5_9BACT|nr:gliding motility-associated C-terminal domain-containing protein [Hymenobacter cavernae]GGF09834.1 hypothetical protein GCM10011383_21300 [Hymenobacter cavernae]